MVVDFSDYRFFNQLNHVPPKNMTSWALKGDVTIQMPNITKEDVNVEYLASELSEIWKASLKRVCWKMVKIARELNSSQHSKYGDLKIYMFTIQIHLLTGIQCIISKRSSSSVFSWNAYVTVKAWNKILKEITTYFIKYLSMAVKV